MSGHQTLSDNQIREIVRLRQVGDRSYRQVAALVGCSVDQAIHYWRTSKLYTGKRPPRSKRVMPHGELAAAAAYLRNEIALAKAEWATAPLFKGEP